MALTVVDNACLRAFNTLGVAARARRLITVDDDHDLQAALDHCGPQGPALVLGGGSNLLFADDVDGAVLRLATRGVQDAGTADGARLLRARAGEPWDSLVRLSLTRGLCGLENLSLIPGTVGASPIQNIGAYGVELSDRFAYLDALHLDERRVRRFSPPECRFAYRDSVFKSPSNRWLIIGVAVCLGPARPLVLGYGDLRMELERRGCHRPTALDVADAVTAIRRRKLPDPAHLGNAGSFFKNPVVPLERAHALAETYPGLPVYPVDAPAQAKLSAGWLIERCGWKGMRQGNAGVHAGHALVLVNHGGASGRELVSLAARIQTSVFERFAVRLEPEPKIVGAALPI